MKRVTGIGGIFFKSSDPESLKDWYRTHLGIEADEDGAMFRWREADDPEEEGQTVWAPFPADTAYFEPTNAPFMINYRVKNLDAVLKALRKEGVWVDEKVEDKPYGRFGWIRDLEGNRIELWEPSEMPPTDDEEATEEESATKK
jgi:predicted enzyme related to lactoylglutathione lyase